MKKVYRLAAILPLLFVSSCSVRGKEAKVTSLSSPVIGTAIGRVKFVNDTDDFVTVINPFNTSIYGNVYYYNGDYTDEQLASMQEDYSYYLSYFHALTDRHYSYTVDDVPINNIKTLNNSYGTGEKVVLDSFLYDTLKKAYQFSLDSDGAFDIFIGELNDIYEDKLKRVGNISNTTALDYALTEASGLVFSSDFDATAIQNAVSYTPATKEEMEGLLTFDDTDKSVIFNSFVKNEVKAPKVSISLSGLAKGEATEWICNYMKKIYPDISLLINSGSSSIKTVGERPDKVAWNIIFTNPVFREKKTETSNLNSSEVALKRNGAFNLSTSGFYEHYFYVYDKDTGAFKRRNHIINPKTGYSQSFFDAVSVVNDDTGLGDMYTTALMNTSSVEEATALFDSLNEKYKETSSDMVLCYRTGDDETVHYQYSISDISETTSGYPKVKLHDDTIYTGDYTDITSFDIKEAVSSLNTNIKEVYQASKGIKDSFYLINDTKIAPYQDKMVSVIKSL